MNIDLPERSIDGSVAVSSAHAAAGELCLEAFMPHAARLNRDCRSQQTAQQQQDVEKHSQPAVKGAEEQIRQPLDRLEAAGARVTLDSHPAWASGLATPVYQWQNENTARPRGVLLMLHAFPMHGKAYDTLARDLASRNFICVAPDMRGFGRTNGQKVSYETTCDRDMLDLASAARKQFPGLPLVACGESMGGSFAIRLAAQPGAVDKLIVSGPGLNLQIGREVDKRDMFLQGANNLIHGAPMDFSNHIRDYYAKDPRVIQEILSDHLVRKQFQLDELLQSPKIAESTKGYISRVSAPVLMLQARDDKMCAPSGVAVMQSKLNSRLKVVEFNDNGHVLIEGSHVRNDVKRAIVDWLDREVPPPHPQTRTLPRTAG
jgi:alpha-beta hydrolase superfamily lysophospholipase